jgi:hypothetical protein
MEANKMIGLIDIDGKLPNLALMKISAYYKGMGEKVEFVRPNVRKHEYEKIFASTIFTKSRMECRHLEEYYGDRIEIGGTGWDIEKVLPPEIESTKPDYDLYTADMIYAKIKGIMTKKRKCQKAQQIVDAGIGFTSRGCIRNCSFCFVPQKEGAFRQNSEIKDIINPRSNVIILNDNNLTADPHCIEKLHEIRDRNLVVDINQGCDVRIMTPEIAKAMSEVRHLRSVHYAWDLMVYEKQIIEGIRIMSRYIPPHEHMCFCLVGYNTSFEEDMYRMKKLDSLGVRPYIMRYNERHDDLRLNHFARWVNSFIYKAEPDFEKYGPWVKDRETYEMQTRQINMFRIGSI